VLRCGAVLELPAGEQAKRGGRHYDALVRVLRLCGTQTLRRPKRMETSQRVTMRAPTTMYVRKIVWISGQRAAPGSLRLRMSISE